MLKIFRLFCRYLTIAIIVLSTFNIEESICRAKDTGSEKWHKELELFSSVLDEVDAHYYDEINKKDVLEGAIRGALSALDPHSAYLNVKEYEESKALVRGSFIGIGVEVLVEKGAVRIIIPCDGGPAFKAGIKPDDLIISIDGQSIEDLSPTDSIAKLRGKPGTHVKLEVLRNGEKLSFNIERAQIQIQPIKLKLIGRGQVALLKINSFSIGTTDSIRKQLGALLKSKKDLDGLILDLRWNPGGLLEESIGVADLFLNKGERIVKIRSKNGGLSKFYEATSFDMTDGIPLIVIINAGSASAAEVVAGALRDNRRALILGTRSFGKGSVQAVFPLLKGEGALKLTTALYYTPSDICIQAIGIEPDVYVQEGMVVKHVEWRSNSEAVLNRHIKNSSSKPEINFDTRNHSIRDRKIAKEGDTDIMKLMSAGDESSDFQLMRAMEAVKMARICWRGKRCIK